MKGKALTVLIVFLSMLLLSSMFGVRLAKTVRASTTNYAYPNWLSGWTYRKQHDITGTSTNLTNYQIVVHYSSWGGEGLVVGKQEWMAVWFPELNQWFELADKPSGYACSAYNNELYLFGSGTDHNETWKYDPSTDSWSQLADMPSMRGWMAHYYPPIDDTIHVFGGRDWDPETETWIARSKKHEVYNVTSNSWETKTDMSHTRSFPCIGLYKDCLYLIGGSADENNPNNGINWNFQYNGTADSWQNKTFLPYRATDAHGLNYKGKFYFMGGWYKKGASAYNLDKCYSYNYTSNSWTEETSLPFKWKHQGGAVIGDYLYLCGGHKGAGAVIDEVWRFNGSSWTKMDTSMPQAVYNFMSCCLNFSGSPIEDETLTDHVFLNEKCRTDFGDVRFTESDGITLLPCWIKDKTDSKYATFVVNVSSIPTPDGTIYIYYGMSGVPVGGIWIPVNKFGLLAPYIGLASTILVATAATAIYVKRRKKKQ